MLQFTELPPLGLYMHFPWCVQKCPYCDFNSHAIKDTVPEQDYISALLSDLELELPSIWGRPIRSIFMGGGTPSLFSPDSLERLLSDLRARLNFSSDIEITLEANPGTVDYDKFQAFHDIGINRLSIGVQSFKDDHLQRLGRIHSARDAIRAVEAAHKAGFLNFNLDLMYALPEQTIKQAQQDIQLAIDLEPTHISHYQLTLEPNTWFYQHPPLLPEDDTIYEIEQACRPSLDRAGYLHYEVSAFSKAGRQCRHNLNYWQFGDYLGIGAGAHGKRTDAHQQQIVRSWKQKNPRDYLSNTNQPEQIAGQQILKSSGITFEFMLNSLRLTDGFETELFSQRCGMPITHIESQLRSAEDSGLIEWGVTKIAPTSEGKRYLNNLIELFLPATSDE